MLIVSPFRALLLATILGSDAHISFQIADYSRIMPLLAETEFPDELIMNYWPDRFYEYLGI